MLSLTEYNYSQIEHGLSQLLGFLFSVLDFHLGTLLHLTDLPLQEKKIDVNRSKG